MLLFRILFIFLIILILIRWLFPFLFRSSWKNTSDQNRYHYKDNRNEGDVNIDYTPKNKKWFDKDSGDYVDYEEID